MRDKPINSAYYMNDHEQKKLPAAFLDRMRRQLADTEEYEAFLESFEKERTYGLRYNPLKMDKVSFLKVAPFVLREIPWAAEGFYYETSDQPGRHALHEAGAFYIQEPSAMAVVSVLDPQPGERILDLCAAPGGKSTQIAGRMRGEGLLVSNEIVPARAKILSQNIERLGVANCVVCREEPGRLAETFPSFFDRVLVDAPCSGEGMFRKDETAIAEWSPENVIRCVARQRDILEQAAGMVCPGGVMVYSTCTFSVQENEEVISGFLKAHPEFTAEDSGMESLINIMPGADKTIRLWPHRIEGEGHFIAKLRRAGGELRAVYRTIAKEGAPASKKYRDKGSHKEKERNKKKENGLTTVELCNNFLYEELGLSAAGAEKLFKKRVLYNFGEAIYLIPEEMIPLEGIQVERPGLQLGFREKDRFKPSHALALCLHSEDVDKCYELTQEQTAGYLRGETLSTDPGLRGWYLLSVQGCTIGFGKASGGQMKNHYPKGLRRQFVD